MRLLKTLAGKTSPQQHMVASSLLLPAAFAMLVATGCVPPTTNPVDLDEDGIHDDWDNCTGLYNPEQIDVDGDDIGAACDTNDNDYDNDGYEDDVDNCPSKPNPDQDYTVCNDLDGDGIADNVDNCPEGDGNGSQLLNPDQRNAYPIGDPNAAGDLCDDQDGDTVSDYFDNCPLRANATQNVGVCTDSDTDGWYDVSADGANDGDNCPDVSNNDQAANKGQNKALGDACDNEDGDDWVDLYDLCPEVAEPDNSGLSCQIVPDADGDGRNDYLVLSPEINGGYFDLSTPQDNCINVPNGPDLSLYGDDQADNYGVQDGFDGSGDACEDSDSDNIVDAIDNCAEISNDQADNYPAGSPDGIGDACDDTDGDGVNDREDACPTVSGIDIALCTCSEPMVDVTYNMMQYPGNDGMYYQLSGTPLGAGDGSQALGTNYHDGSPLSRTMTIRFTDTNGDGVPDTGPAWIVQVNFGNSFSTSALGSTVYTEVDTFLPNFMATGTESTSAELIPGLLSSYNGVNTVAGLELTHWETTGVVYCPSWGETSTSGMVCSNAGAGNQAGVINPDFTNFTVSGFGIGSGTLSGSHAQIASTSSGSNDKMNYGRGANVEVRLFGTVQSLQTTPGNEFCD